MKTMYEENPPALTEEETARVLYISHQIAECINERDKLFIYNSELNNIYRKVWQREHGRKEENYAK